MADRASRVRIAKNFVERYGAEGLARFLEALGDGQSGQAIADEFQVSRERVRQWKNAFGQSVTLYQVFPEIRSVLSDAAAKPE